MSPETTKPTNSSPTNSIAQVERYESGFIEPPHAHAWAVIFILLVFFLLGSAIKEILKERKLLRQAQAADLEDKPLSVELRIVAGVAQYAQGESLAIRTEIDQTGSETRKKNNVRHNWDEDARRTTARPFYLVRKDGKRIRVEPTEESLLIDSIDEWRWRDKKFRTGTAQISAGEWVIAEGLLQRGDDPEAMHEQAGYRGQIQGWVMRKSPDAPLHLSAENLTRRHRLRLNRLNWNFILILLASVIIGALFSSHALRTFAGETRTAEVIAKRHYTTKTDNGKTVDHWTIRYRALNTREGKPLEGKAHLARKEWASLDEGDRLPVCVVRHWPRFMALGSRSSIHFFPVLFSGFLWVVAMGMTVSAHDARRWYQGKLKHSGSGPLPEPPKATEPAKVRRTDST